MCSTIIDHGIYCIVHDGLPPPVQPRPRLSPSKRGYTYQYTKFRESYLADHPYCTDCNALAEEVHHLVKVRHDPLRIKDSTNVVGLCKRCHVLRTNRGE